MCLKCSRRQNAMKPRREMKTVLCHFDHVFHLGLAFILLLLYSLPIVFSHINRHRPPSRSIPPFFPRFFFLSPERKNKQLSGSGLHMNSKRLTRAEGAKQLSPEEGRRYHTWMKTSTRAASNKFGQLRELRTRTHTHTESHSSLNQ